MSEIVELMSMTHSAFADRPTIEASSRGDAQEPKILYSQTVNQEIVASNNPRANKPPRSIEVPPGYAFYFLTAVNNRWTDNGGNGSNPPLSGYWFEHQHQYIYNAKRAQLVSLAGNGYVAYEESIDRSKGGTYVYVNSGASTWSLQWYMNDNVNPGYYENNVGTANITVVVYRFGG